MNRLINVNAKEGDKVVFIGDSGYSVELEYAKRKLKIGETYTVLYTINSEFQATICLEEFPADDFDTYMFIDAANFNKYIIEKICDNHRYLGITEEEAELILYEIKDIIVEEKLIKFIHDDLCIFRSKEKAFNWFNDGDKIDVDEIDFEITQDMVGKDVIDVLLENKENYIRVNDTLHLTHWL